VSPYFLILRPCPLYVCLFYGIAAYVDGPLSSLNKRWDAIQTVKNAGGGVATDRSLPQPLRRCLATELAEACERVDTVFLGTNGRRRELADGDLCKVTELIELRRLCVESDEITEDGVAGLMHLKNLEALVLRGRRLADAAFIDLTRLAGLRSLALEGPGITDETCRRIKELKELQYLSLSGTRVSDLGARELVALDKLEHLWLDRTRVSDGALRDLTVRPALKRLSLAQTAVSDRGMPYLKRLRNLTAIVLDGTNVSDEGLRFLHGMSWLTSVSVADTKVSERGVAQMLSAMAPWSFCSREPAAEKQRGPK